MVFKVVAWAIWRATHFPWVSFTYTWSIHVNKFLCFFFLLLICFLLTRGPQPRTQKDRGNLFFPSPTLVQQLARISGWWQQSIEPSTGAFWVQGSAWLHRSHAHAAGPVRSTLYFLLFACERNQNIPPRNMLLWHKDYFELKAIEKRWHRKNSLPPPFCLKPGHKFPFIKVI